MLLASGFIAGALIVTWVVFAVLGSKFFYPIPEPTKCAVLQSLFWVSLVGLILGFFGGMTRLRDGTLKTRIFVVSYLLGLGFLPYFSWIAWAFCGG